MRVETCHDRWTVCNKLSRITGHTAVDISRVFDQIDHGIAANAISDYDAGSVDDPSEMTAMLLREHITVLFNAKDHGSAAKDAHDPKDLTIRSLRDAARSLCEKLQDECSRAHWKPELIHLVEAIERSERVLPPIGRVTTLKSAREI